MSTKEKSVPAMQSSSRGFATKAIHGGYSPKSSQDHPVVPPIVHSVAHVYETIEFPQVAHGYSRYSNPTRSILQKTIATLEGAEYGLCYSSGSAAIFAISYLLNPGDHMVCGRVLYGGTIKQFKKYSAQKGLEISFVDPLDTSNVEKAIKENTKMVFVETPLNPLLAIIDLEELSGVVKSHPGVIFVVDNTFMTPYFQNPMKYGADIVVHSLSKYMNGLGDVVMGSLVTNRKDLYLRLNDILTSIGPMPSPIDCSLVIRSLKTLHLRMREHQKNALAVAKFLESHPLVEKVIYPGLPSHPQHELAKKQCNGFSGMVSFFIHGDRSDAEKFIYSLEVVTNTGSLGYPQSLISCPATVSHAMMTEEERQRIGITDNLLRLSVGLETEEDIINDLAQALEKLGSK